MASGPINNPNSNPDQSNIDNSKEKIKKIQKEIDDTKEIMLENIEQAIKRGDHLITIENNTQDIQNQANNFLKKTRNLKNEMCWRKYILHIITGIIFLFVASIIVGIIVYSSVNASNTSNTSPSSTNTPESVT